MGLYGRNLGDCVARVALFLPFVTPHSGRCKALHPFVKATAMCNGYSHLESVICVEAAKYTSRKIFRKSPFCAKRPARGPLCTILVEFVAG